MARAQARRQNRVVGFAWLLLAVTFKSALALPPDPAVEVDGFVTFRNLGSTGEACQLILDTLNSRGGSLTCSGAFHITPCPTDSDIKANTPPTAGSITLQDRLARGYANFGSGFCQEDPGPLSWQVWELCPTSPFVYTGNGECKCPAGQYESGGSCVNSCPSDEWPWKGSCVTSGPKNNGGCDVLGNPCNPGTGIKTQREQIYKTSTPFGLELSLTYNSEPVGNPKGWTGAFGRNWISTFERKLTVYTDGTVTARRIDGKEWDFHAPGSGNRYLADPDIIDVLDRITDGFGVTTGWKVTAASGDEVETYDANGTLQSVTNRTGLAQTYSYTAPVTGTETTPAQRGGLISAVTDNFGRQIIFHYDSKGRVNRVTDLAGHDVLFEYDGTSGGCSTPGASDPGCSANNVTKITFQDLTTRVFWYNESSNVNGGVACSGLPNGLVNHLTGITDENGNRFATYQYDCFGRAVSTEHAGNVEHYAFTFNADGTTTVIDPIGTNRGFGFQNVLGVVKATGISQPCNSCGAFNSASTGYDANGNVSSRTDWNGNRTNYSYEATRNLELSRTEALTSSGASTPQTRTITTEWHSIFRLPTRVAEPLRITTNTYDLDGAQCGARGALCSKTIQATSDPTGSLQFNASLAGSPRTWTYTYNSNGSVLTVDGPRAAVDVSDVTTYTYYANDDADLGKRGNVATITNPLGPPHVTSITAYNAHGQPLTIVDANGMTTTLSYNDRQRLTSRNVGGETTSYDYDNAGQLTKVTLPDGSYLSYTYDAAHRLTEIKDNLDNRISYTLDAMGNRTQEQVFDPASQLVQMRSRVYDSLNRLFHELGAQSQTTEYGYDDQGNVTSVKDPLNHTRINQYDALNRLSQVTDPAPGLGVTLYAYNGLDALTQVTDPRNLITGYTVDGLGNLTQQVSPDTGTTASTYDATGNLLTQTDAKSQITRYAYDALNRVSAITFHDGSTQTYAYDDPLIPYSIGRLCRITETDSATQITSVIAYAYDQHGRVASDTRTVAGMQYVIRYRYDTYGRLDQVTYPSGRTVNYTFDTLGRVSAIDTTKAGGQAENVVSNISYHPFGGVKSFAFGNGQSYTRSIDLDGRIASYTLGPQTFAIGYDDASRIQFISETGNPPNTNTYGYDELDRLTSAATQTTGYGYSYDTVGNRSSRTAGANTDTYTYSSTSNRIASITPQSGPVRNFTFDENGSARADGVNTYGYDTRGRMVSATSSIGATSYQVNALGQRVRKTSSLGDSVFHYDAKGHLIAETSPTGALKRELIYLGDIPVGVVQ